MFFSSQKSSAKRPTAEAETELRREVIELHQKYRQLVERRCTSILGDAAAADDAVQEVFVRVLQNIHAFRRDSSPVTWLYRITTNICLDEIRRRSRRGEQLLTPELEGGLRSSEQNTEQRLVHRQSLEKLLHDLDPTSMQILVYCYLDRMPQEEIAALLGTSRRTVSTKLKRLRALLEARKS